MTLGIVELYQGSSGKQGYYNSQEIGLARAMKKMGYKCLIFYPDSNVFVYQIQKIEDGIQMITCPAINIGVHSKYNWNILQKCHVDVVQIGSDNQIFAPGLIRFCDKHKIPVYCFIGTVDSDTVNPLKKIGMNLLFRRNIQSYKRHKCFVKTNAVKRQLTIKGMNQSELACVGLDTAIIPDIPEQREALRKKAGISENTTVLLFVGRMEEYKRPFETLFLLEYLLRKKKKEVFMIMIGTGKLDEKFEKEMQKKKLKKYMKRLRKIPNEKIHRYYKIADYFLNFNTDEIFGMSILEAMYQGCTVIANHAPGPDSIIENKKSGFLVNTTDQMAELIINGYRCDRENVKGRVKEMFLWDTTAAKFDRWIRTCK